MVNIFSIEPEDLNQNNSWENILASVLFNSNCIVFTFNPTDETSFNYIEYVINFLKLKEKILNSMQYIIISNYNSETYKNIKDQEFEEKLKNCFGPSIFKYFNLNSNTDLYEEAFEYIKQKLYIKNKINIFQWENYNKANFIRIKTVYKIILLGDSEVGKSSFFKRYFNEEFDENFLLTVGVNDNSKYMKINQCDIKLQIWDTAGQERFRSLPRKYYQHADGIILIYDITNKKSFENVSKWLKDISENTDQKLIIYIVGNKIDLINKRVVSFDEAKETFNGSFDKINFFEISCKLDINISETILSLAQDIYRSYKIQDKTNTFSFSINDKNHKSNSCCISRKK